MSSSIGIDAKKFSRTGSRGNFLAMMGIGVEVKNYSHFKEKYSQVISDLLKKNGIAPSKKVYKSFDLLKMGLKVDFLKDFFNKIIPEIETINFFYSFFPNKVTKEEKDSGDYEDPILMKIRIFRHDNKKTITSMEFISQFLSNSFPHICAWEMYSQNNYEGSMYIDDFHSNITHAWEGIEKKEKLFVLPNGDKSNALISTADIMLTYFDRVSFIESKGLRQEDIESVFGKKVKTHFISTACLYNIVPLSSKIQINKYNKLMHPVVFILNERSKFVGKNTIENSPLLNKIVDICFKNDGCFKLFDPDSDHKFINPEDYLIFFGKEGEKSIDSLKRLGYRFNSTSFDKL